MKRWEFIAFMFAIPLTASSQEKEPTVDELKETLTRALALLDHYATTITELQEENDKLRETLSIDRGCT